DDEIRVVAVGGDDDRVGVLDAGRPQHARVHAMADDEPAGPVLAQAAEGGLLLVNGRHVPAFRGETFRDRRAHPATADNDELHTLSVARRSTFLSSTASSKTPWHGGACDAVERTCGLCSHVRRTPA